MSEDIRTQQRWLIAGVAILALLLIFVVAALVRSMQPKVGEAHIGHRSPADALAYCAPQDTKLCIVSFGQVEGGDMLVNLQVPRLFYPEFALVINRYGVESSYECQEAKGISMGVTCAGPSQVPGEILQFKIIAREGDTLLAEGKLSIIGIAISTPEEDLTATPTVTPMETPSELTPFPTAVIPTQEIPTQETPTPLLPPTDYPSTSYP